MHPKEIREKYLNGEFKLKAEFLSGNYKREETLSRCERYAGWTLPTAFPNDPLNEYDEMQNDYQSVGAQAVINLANKIMLALFQPSKPFFRLQLTDDQRASAMTALNLDKAGIEKLLADAERAAMRELDKVNARVVLTDIIQLLIITGNALLYIPEDGTMQSYSLRDYTIQRDLRGVMCKAIIRETKAVEGLSTELQAMAAKEGYGELDEVSVYTGILRINKTKYVVWQELEDVCYCHRTEGIYKIEDLPWIPLTWNLCRNKDYGTGLVENYSGDFHSLSSFAEARLDYSTIVTDLKFLVNPAGMTDPRKVSEAPSGAFVHGREEDISVLQHNVQDATNFLRQEFDAIERRIGAAFLLNTSVTRDAERVTATELRMQAQELEGSLGGVYSRLASELQTPIATRLLRRIDDIFDEVEPTIVTGLESLSRNSELDRWRYLFQDLISLSDVPEQVAQRINYGDLIKILGSGHGVETDKVLKSEEEVKKAQEEAIAAQAQAAGQETQAVEEAKGQIQNG